MCCHDGNPKITYVPLHIIGRLLCVAPRTVYQLSFHSGQISERLCLFDNTLLEHVPVVYETQGTYIQHDYRNCTSMHQVLEKLR